METLKSRFNKAAARGAKVGAKVSNDVRAQLTCERQPNRLTLNAMASKLLMCKGGMYIKIFVNEEAERIEDKFAIAVFKEGDGNVAKLAQTGETADIGRPCSFNYAGMWSIMYQEDVEAIEIGNAALQDKGMMEEYITTVKEDGSEIRTLLGNKKVSFGLQKIEDAGTIDDLTYEALYALVDMEVEVLEAPSISRPKSSANVAETDGSEATTEGAEGTKKPKKSFL